MLARRNDAGDWVTAKTDVRGVKAQGRLPGLGLLGAALLTGCAVGPTYHAPAAPTADRFTRHPLSEATTAAPTPGGQAQRFVATDLPGRWWELFQSPALNRLVERALASNPDLQSAQAALRVARENHDADKGARYPQVEADFSASRQKNPVSLASPLASNAEYFGLNTGQLSIAYTPDLFGGVRRQIESSAAEVQNQRFTLEAAYLTLTTNVVVAALQEASLRGQIRATQRSIALGETVLRQMTMARRSGEIAEGDVAAQEAALAQARLSLPPLQKQLAQQQDLLAVLTGGLPSETADDTIELADLQLPTTLPVSLPAEIVRQRPDIRAAEANLHSASALIGVAVANRLPNITLTGLYGGTSEKLDRLFAPDNILWSLTGGVTQPIFEGGALRHKQRAAEAAYDQAAAQYRSTVHTAFQNVADTLEALDQDARALKSTADAQRATAASLEIARRAFRYGEVNSLAVLNAEQTEAAADLVLVQAQAARYADTVALFQALGGGWWNRTDSPPR
jgi:NodT family efflux transporter outer membrane factor (OMF) lipoprotein